MPQEQDDRLMARALDQASRALAEGVMPIGAVLACGRKVIAEAYWKGLDHGLLSHPEHVVLTEADPSITFADRRNTTLYTTLEPCLMCMGTAMSFFLRRIVFAMNAPVDGATDVARRWHPRQGHPTGSAASYSVPETRGGVREAEARSLVRAWLDSGVTGADAEFARLTLA